MKILILLFLVCIFGCQKNIVDCECNDGIIFKDTRDTIICSKHLVKEWIQYKDMCTGKLIQKDTMVYVTHGGFKQFIIR